MVVSTSPIRSPSAGDGLKVPPEGRLSLQPREKRERRQGHPGHSGLTVSSMMGKNVATHRLSTPLGEDMSRLLHCGSQKGHFRSLEGRDRSSRHGHQGRWRSEGRGSPLPPTDPELPKMLRRSLGMGMAQNRRHKCLRSTEQTAGM